MDKISDDINIMFQELFGSTKHPFFEDIHKVNKLSKNYINNMKRIIQHEIPFEPNINIPEGHIIEPKYNILKKEKIYELKKEMNNVMNWKKILSIVSFMSQYLLESNVKNEKMLYKKLKTSNMVNIMIIGSGPIGLFLACYLNLYYNHTSMTSSHHVNIVIYDNRIDRPGFRKPYTRQRPFVTSSSYLNLVIPKIYCWNEKNTDKTSLWVNIFMLEYLLYTTALTQSNISIIYKDYDWNEYKNIIKKSNFKVIFDCSGGRFKNDIIQNINIKWLDKFNNTNKKIGKKLLINKTKNLVELIDLKNNDKFKKNYYYGSISIHKNDNTLTFVTKYDIDIVNNYDLLYLNNLKHKNFTFSEMNEIIKGISDNISRNFLNAIFTNRKTLYHDYILVIDVFTIYIRHAIKICDIVKINKKKVLYIGAGDTIFHSHFITGAGLNRTLDFTVKCANLLINI